MDIVRLFDNKTECCACGACMNICAQHAISMKQDEYGFLYPSIDQAKCVRCGLCKKVCSFQNKEEITTAKNTYVGVSRDEQLLKKSASGGIFAEVATEIIKREGVVFGCALDSKNGRLVPEHIMVDDLSQLFRIQGSKYVQSTVGDAYRQVKEALKQDRLVLFSGTPCQVAGLKGYLDEKKYNNLLTIDIVCHGVPSAAFFEDYIVEQERKNNKKISGFKFRDKTNGWGLMGSIDYQISKEEIKTELLPVALSSYYTLFLHSDVYRENCYSCKYAGPFRPGDITIGDYWGVQYEHPDYLVQNGGEFDEKKGISCILVNTEQGDRLLKDLGIGIQYKMSSFEKAARENGQLVSASHRSKRREEILTLYKNEGYAAVEKWYFKQLGIKKYLYKMRTMLPEPTVAFLRKIKKKIKA